MDPQALIDHLDRMEHALADARPALRDAVLDVTADILHAAQVLVERLDRAEERLHWIARKVSVN